MKRYNAPWSRLLVVLSCVLTVILLGTAALLAYFLRGILRWESLLPPALLVCCALYTVRGYTLAPDTLLVHRPFWSTRVPLSGLQSAFEPDAMRGSIRTLGNGGLFSITGHFRNKSLGAYRAFVTDQQRTVVLRFTGLTVVVSPASPEEFVREIGDCGKAA